MAFYKALHLVDAMLDVDGEDAPSDHGTRAGTLKRKYQFLWTHYRVLLTASYVARYLSDSSGSEYRTFTDFMTPEQVYSELVLKRLGEVETAVIARLNAKQSNVRFRRVPS